MKGLWILLATLLCNLSCQDVAPCATRSLGPKVEQCQPRTWPESANFQNPKEAGPAPWTLGCDASVCLACRNDCDCKFAKVDCAVAAVSTANPWNAWDRDQAMGSCRGICGPLAPPPKGTIAACVNGTCGLKPPGP